MFSHMHKFKFDSQVSNAHKHALVGHTHNILGINAFHFHYFYGVCSHNGHSHYYSGFTGLPIRTANGHIHKVEGILEINNLHDHRFNNYTFEEIEYTNGKRPVTYRRWAFGNN